MLDILYAITTVAIGLFAGALLTEASILVPYWQRMKPADFFHLHSELGPNLFRYFAPLTIISVSLSVTSAAVSTYIADTSVWRITAAILCLTALVIFFIYFKKTNAKFTNHSLGDVELGPTLKRWAQWHWSRTALIIAAFLCSVLAQIH